MKFTKRSYQPIFRLKAEPKISNVVFIGLRMKQYFFSWNQYPSPSNSVAAKFKIKTFNQTSVGPRPTTGKDGRALSDHMP